ncbi:auxin-responsive protein IAA25-like [Tasmannia lanceolata]|uniref:auxin-responsive protein IAA25-like n=1 Tax=Tasmannia lanceolata TaxID=3420 RepID=UPI0040647E4C
MQNRLHETPQKDEEEGLQMKSNTTFQNHLGPKTRETELRLGFSLNGFDDMAVEGKSGPNGLLLKQRNGGFGAKRWFSETEGGFENTWRLDNKAVFDQNHHNTSSPVSRASPVVGWPPVRTFRKNLVPQPKPEIEKKAMATSGEAPEKVENSMFVKVNMEGYAVGRKINLKAHDSYESLSLALQKMFSNFYSSNYFKTQEQNEEVEVVTPEHVLIYEDNEGDRMLVGDVPWEMFISTVKRLYIISGSKAPALVAGRMAKNQQ